MVTVAELRPKAALVKLLSDTVNVSFPSLEESLVKGTVNAPCLLPAAIRIEPELAVKSVPEVAVLPAVA